VNQETIMGWIILFWLSAVGVVYLFAGFPVLAMLLSRLFPFTPQRGRNEAPISVVVVGYNEAARWKAKLDTILASSIAPQIAEILIGSDGSDDKTADVIAAYSDSRVRLVAYAERRGKPAVLNDLVPQCQSEIVVLMDARQELDPQAIEKLASCLCDPRVGVVSGELVFRTDGAATSAAEGIGFYWKYEKAIRKAESRFRSVPGATGALYAIRKSLFRPIPPQTLLDDVVIPMQAVEQGYRCLLEPGAIAYDRPSSETRQESVRKRRTIAGAAQLILNQPRWLVPWRNPIWWEFVSHKIGRLVSPLLLATCLIANLVLLSVPLYQVLLAVQVAFYAMALAGYVCQRAGIRSRLAGACLMFVALNTVTVAALWDALRGRFRATWQRTA
jgi:biofilm PGA synthesis N-glycosyltransferase PgaC